MTGEHAARMGPDLTRGFRRSDVPDEGMVAGHSQGTPVLVARRADQVFGMAVDRESRESLASATAQ
jgi:hypothetical protein